MSEQGLLPPVLVLFGGRSAESDVSVISGTAIAAALLDAGLDVTQAHIARDGSLRPLPATHRRGDFPGDAYTDLTAPALLGAQPMALDAYLRSVAASAPTTIVIPALHDACRDAVQAQRGITLATEIAFIGGFAA